MATARKKTFVIANSKYRSRWRLATDVEVDDVNDAADDDAPGGGGTGTPVEIFLHIITATDVARKYFLLPTAPASETDVTVSIGGAPGQTNGVDYAVEPGSKRIMWSGLALDGIIAENDSVTVIYKE